MAKTPDQMLDTMKANLPEKTGKSLEQWIAIVKASGLEKHGEQVKLLKDQGVGHGYANMICHAAKGDFETVDDNLVANQYKGKETLRPICEAITAYGAKLGKDVEIAPRKTNVTLRRSKNFAVVTPASKSRSAPQVAVLAPDRTSARSSSHSARLSPKVKVTAPG